MVNVLITGANRGIGAEMARQFVHRGDAVIACAREPSTIPPIEGAVERLKLDVTDQGDVDSLSVTMGPRVLDVLVCNAGVLEGRGGIEDAAYTMENFRRTFDVNVAGVFLTIRACLPALRRAKQPRVCVLSSQMGSTERAKKGAYSYRASKAAATNLAVCLSHELREDGIAVNAYHPGWVRTDMGTDSADISVEESAAGLLSRFDDLNVNRTGQFLSYSGQPIPF